MYNLSRVAAISLSLGMVCCLPLAVFAFSDIHGDSMWGPVYDHADCSTGENISLLTRIAPEDAGSSGCIKHDAIQKYLDYVPPDRCKNDDHSYLCKLILDLHKRLISHVTGSILIVIGVIGIAATLFMLWRLRKSKPKHETS
jgi:hypothetical protein